MQQAGSQLHAAEGNVPQPAWGLFRQGSGHPLLVRNTYWKQRSLHHCYFSIHQISYNFMFGTDLWTTAPKDGNIYACIFPVLHTLLPAISQAVLCNETACPCSWENANMVLHLPSQSDFGAPQIDWSSCPFQRCSSFLPHRGSSRCDTPHALAVYPRTSWRPPRLFPDILKAQERSGVSTTGVLLGHRWSG